MSSKTEITNIILSAIENKDKNKLAEYFVRAKKSKIDSDILKEAKKLLKELPEAQEAVREEPIPEPVKQEPVPVKNIYTAARRRR